MRFGGNGSDMGNRPDEAEKLASDGYGGLVRDFPLSHQPVVAFVETLLSVPSDRAGRCGRLALAFLQFLRDGWLEPAVPRGFDYDAT